MSAGISIREFARRDGCDDKLVRRAIGQGKLQALPDGSLDPALIGTGWRKTNRRADASADSARTVEQVSAAVSAPLDVSAESLDPDELAGFLRNLLKGKYAKQADAERIKENSLAGIRVLELQQKAGALVDLSTAETVLFETFRAYRDAWLNWPIRVGALMAAELKMEPEPLVGALTKYVHQQLSDLGEPEADFVKPE